MCKWNNQGPPMNEYIFRNKRELSISYSNLDVLGVSLLNGTFPKWSMHLALFSMILSINPYILSNLFSLLEDIGIWISTSNKILRHFSEILLINQYMQLNLCQVRQISSIIQHIQLDLAIAKKILISRYVQLISWSHQKDLHN